jgi:hypothetical protein
LPLGLLLADRHRWSQTCVAGDPHRLLEHALHVPEAAHPLAEGRLWRVESARLHDPDELELRSGLAAASDRGPDVVEPCRPRAQLASNPFHRKFLLIRASVPAHLARTT